MLTFFTTYLLFLFASSIAITAFFCVTRGYTEVMPDGSVHRYGKILKGYYFFWFKESGKKQIPYVGDELAYLLLRAKEYTNEPTELLGKPFEPFNINAFRTTPGFMQQVPLLRKKLEVQFGIVQQQENSVVLQVYVEEPVYVYPEWLRTVMAGCITCTPTVYGNVIYWGTMWAIKDSVLYDSFFSCFANAQVGVVLVWLAYWVSLAWLNTVLWNVYDR